VLRVSACCCNALTNAIVLLCFVLFVLLQGVLPLGIFRGIFPNMMIGARGNKVSQLLKYLQPRHFEVRSFFYNFIVYLAHLFFFLFFLDVLCVYQSIQRRGAVFLRQNICPEPECSQRFELEYPSEYNCNVIIIL
jgi:hypothetical protein